jgi:membrane associated rhomboid family serine protease
MVLESDSTIDFDSRTGVTPAVRWLIVANVGVFFLQLAIFGGNTIAAWFALSAAAFPSHWWAVGTYMFVHAGVAHLASNMFMLWMFGPRVERLFGTRSFLYFYLWCGVGGAIFHLLFTHGVWLVGASGAVTGVILAYALRWPDEEVYLLGAIPMKARWLAIWMIAVNVGMALANAVGYGYAPIAWVTHVGGLVFAWLYLHIPAGSSLDRIRQHVALAPDHSDPNPIPQTPRSTRQHEGDVPRTASDAVAQSNAQISAQRSALDRHRTASTASALMEQESIDDVNALLDKISRDGMKSLTPSERQLLESVSRRLRNS